LYGLVDSLGFLQDCVNFLFTALLGFSLANVPANFLTTHYLLNFLYFWDSDSVIIEASAYRDAAKHTHKCHINYCRKISSKSGTLSVGPTARAAEASQSEKHAT
jgi:hypothetical protein